MKKPHCFGQYLKDKACKVCRLKTKCKQYEKIHNKKTME